VGPAQASAGSAPSPYTSGAGDSNQETEAPAYPTSRPSGLGSIVRQASMGKVDVEHGGSSGSASSPDTVQSRALRALVSLGVPWGLARLIYEEDRQIALRLFVLDNSFSTSNYDGRLLKEVDEIEPSGGGRLQAMQPCTRWEEIMRLALKQADWNACVGTPCEYFLLNPISRRPSGLFRDGVDFVRVDSEAGDHVEQRRRLQHMLVSTGPRGPTPLSSLLSEIYARVEREHSALVRAGQRVIIVIATDGLPTSETSGQSSPLDRKTFVEVLRHLCTNLPVNVVIRLTTGEQQVVDFYGKVDEEPELALEVIDDFESEAKEVCRQGTLWLTYSPLIHTIREGGTFVKLFDVIDERCLSTIEALLLARLLLQRDGERDPPLDPRAFCNFAAERIKQLDMVYEPITKRMQPVIEVIALRYKIVPVGSFLVPWRRHQLTPRVKGSWWRACLQPRSLLRKRRRAEEPATVWPELQRSTSAIASGDMCGEDLGAFPLPVPVGQPIGPEIAGGDVDANHSLEDGGGPGMGCEETLPRSRSIDDIDNVLSLIACEEVVSAAVCRAFSTGSGPGRRLKDPAACTLDCKA